MNSGATAERVHEVLKARIMGREFRPGDRLDPAVLAAPLGASVTPVRDALHLLTGEGLVETRTSGGFHVPALDEPALRDRYDWSAALLGLSIRGWPRAARPAPQAATGDIADRTAALFLAIARCSANSEHARAVERLNAQLHAVRLFEPHVLDAIEDELAELATAALQSGRDRLRRCITGYHSRRRRTAAAIVRAVYRTDQP
ncbi:GntR family transcriptional regulator [Sphingomonas paucimobilis]|uniref:GntR family transcriptional regulator n=1 Tax=Sphingomonas paucimobilis TaxID=13689 RepID=A0A7Y2KLY0_SPHPI|nr:GntR family transcriptional regulator [Sphingomonas paucimobilis]NNG56414.1 GntR family transcriptional regulator [Sphingomonas paucimobilis]